MGDLKRGWKKGVWGTVGGKRGGKGQLIMTYIQLKFRQVSMSSLWSDFLGLFDSLWLLIELMHAFSRSLILPPFELCK